MKEKTIKEELPEFNTNRPTLLKMLKAVLYPEAKEK